VVIALTGAHLLTPLGDSGPSTCAAIRAKLGGFVEHPWLTALGKDPRWDPPEPLRAALVPAIDPFEAGRERLMLLARGALTAGATALRLRRKELARSAFFLALPEPEAVLDALDLGSFGAELLQSSGITAVGAAHVSRLGRPGTLELIGHAATSFANRQADAALVLAVDSYFDHPRIQAWDERRRLRSERVKDGLLPGEAAALLLFEPYTPPPRRPDDPDPRPPLALVETPAAANEPNPLLSDRASTATALCDAIRGALAPLAPDASVKWLLSDMTGEAYGGFELAVARARLATALAGARLDHPADAVGDVGAAASAILLACAAHGFARDPSAPDAALILSSSDGPLRAAVLARRPR